MKRLTCMSGVITLIISMSKSGAARRLGSESQNEVIRKPERSQSTMNNKSGPQSRRYAAANLSDDRHGQVFGGGSVPARPGEGYFVQNGSVAAKIHLSGKGVQSCMIRRVIRSPVACLMLVIAAILGVGSLSNCAAKKMVPTMTPAPAPGSARQTPHLVFSTYLGGSKACFPGGSPYLRPERRLRRAGEYLRDRRHPGLRPSRAERLPTGPRG